MLWEFKVFSADNLGGNMEEYYVLTRKVLNEGRSIKLLSC